MSLLMINKDRLTAAIMLNMMLMAALFVVTVLTISLYADNKQNEKNILAREAPIDITLNIGAPPPVIEVATTEEIALQNALTDGGITAAPVENKTILVVE
ncbi:MAG: hypothetical protein J6N72_00645 [Psychrobacter sp.]|nr:hypothetical protein [Psychrobacter sp.]